MKRLFSLGQLVQTSGLRSHKGINHIDKLLALRRHQKGDWGDVDTSSKTMNDDAVICNERLLSVYKSEAGVKFWIITEADRSVTTLLLPEEY